MSGAYVVTRDKVPTLEPKHLQAFLKRLRSSYKKRIRFFAVGEYGEVTARPHYHLAIFGFPVCVNGRTNHLNKTCCSVCEMVSKAWGQGSIDVGELTPQSAKYIAGYCEKKWKKEEVCQSRKTPKGQSRPIYLKDGRRREFTRMSNRPGIGAAAIKLFTTFGGLSQRKRELVESIDAPVVLRNSGSILPLGRYLRRKWREAFGRSADTPESVLGQYRKELYSVLKEDEEAVPSGLHSAKAKAAFHHWRKNCGKIKSLESRAKIFKTRRVI